MLTYRIIFFKKNYISVGPKLPDEYVFSFQNKLINFNHFFFCNFLVDDYKIFDFTIDTFRLLAILFFSSVFKLITVKPI